jgi:acyl-CoA thioesterase-2
VPNPPPTHSLPEATRLTGDGLLGFLCPVREGDQVWLAHRLDGNLNGRVFGGQLLAHATWVGLASTPGRHLSSLRLGFLQGAKLVPALQWEAQPLQQGSRYSTFQLNCTQSQRMIATAQFTAQVPGQGFLHAQAAPQVPPPEDLPTLEDLEAHVQAQTGEPCALQSRPWLDLRLIDSHEFLLQPSSQPRLRYWLRVRDPLPDDPAVHGAALAYLSDFWFNYASLATHQGVAGARSQLYVASLNHALWVYAPCRADDWLLFDVHSPRAGDGRGLAMGSIYDRGGRLVASVAQEMACSLREP